MLLTHARMYECENRDHTLSDFGPRRPKIVVSSTHLRVEHMLHFLFGV